MSRLYGSRRPRPPALAVAALAAASLGLAACSSGGSPSSSPSSGSSSGASAPSASATPAAHVTMSVADESAFISLPVVLAKQLGYYSKEGVDVTLQSATGGAQAADSLVSGSTGTAVVAFDTLLQLDAKKPDYSSFVTLTRDYTGLLVAAPGNTKIKSIKDLAHTTVGITSPGSSSERFVKYLLSKNGVPASSVSFVGVGVGSTSIAALEHGKVSTAFLLQPALTLLQKQNPGKHITILANTQTPAGDQKVFGTPDYPATVVAAKTTWLSQNPAAAKGLAKAVSMALQWIQQHSAQQIANKMPSSFYGGDKPTYVKALASLKPSFSPRGAMPPDGATSVNKVLKQFLPGFSQKSEPIGKTYTNKYVSGS